MVETCPPPACSTPRHAVPAGACDAHSHVFGAPDRFALLYLPHYPLPMADAAAHGAMRARIGMHYGVLTQPAAYGEDPAAMLDAIAGSKGALRGVAVAGPAIAPNTLARWREGGIVGLRFSEFAPGRPRFPGSVGFDALPRLAPLMRDLGLHAQLWGPMDVLVQHLPALLYLGLPLVVDHMGMPTTGQPQAFERFCDLLARHDLWVKLSLCRVGSAADDYAAARAWHDALVTAAPDRCLWGSDWPYVAMSPAPDAADLLDHFFDWLGDAALASRILAANPARLYGFTGE